MATVTYDRCRRVIEADMATVQCLGILKDTVGQADPCGPCAAGMLCQRTGRPCVVPTRPASPCCANRLTLSGAGDTI
jgi:hypothetical protein